ncbi:winged helix-turn-helix domain-containing protein [Aeromonas salmonicida]
MSGDCIKFIVESDKIRSLDNQVSKRLSYAEVAIMIALINAKGEVVSRDELMSLGWPGKIVVPNSLNMAILALRRSLNSFGISEYIVTIPRVGFRLDYSHLFGYTCDDFSAESRNDTEKNLQPDVVELYNGEAIAVSEQTTASIYSEKDTGEKNSFLLDCMLTAILIFDIVFVFNLSSNQPELECEMLDEQVQVCGKNINEGMLSAARHHLSYILMKSQLVLWAEQNPHQKDGYKFYIVEGG